MELWVRDSIQNPRITCTPRAFSVPLPTSTAYPFFPAAEKLSSALGPISQQPPPAGTAREAGGRFHPLLLLSASRCQLKGEVFCLGVEEPNHLEADQFAPLENEVEVRADSGAQE